ncbi:hypothetical protein BS47DRAFT_1339430 [Hydnum rufescens UP504]|uniref:ABC transporter domain-containing protein n=1 Tax=Hydnum rufescens UP504 TaxID=1448309 RepID=A0A9P6E012_9AGAM|nr:hypothetical protein BS47DRAFT_1339430 [Hydnum rufescens UP504]
MDPEAPLQAGHALEWSNLAFASPNGEKILLSNQSGHLRSGRMLAGKSTFLDVLSRRSASSGENSLITFDGTSDFEMRRVVSYIEQDDALLGVLTVYETVEYAARLSLPYETPNSVISSLVNTTLESLGLTDVANNRIGTPIQRGVSGGQKRRVTIATSVVSRPRVLLCDEPTSGLDSMASFQVVSSVKKLAQANDTIVIATIHQPNWETLSLFDDVLFLSGGHCIYHGPVVGIVPYFAALGYPCAPHTNPGDHVISLINVDFHSTSQVDIGDKPSPAASAQDRLSHIAEAWRTRNPSDSRNDHIVHPNSNGAGIADNTITSPLPPNLSPEGLPRLISDPSAIWAARDRHRLSDEVNRIRLLIQRAFLNYRRNLLAYGIRIAMYGGVGVLLATVWIHLGTEDTKINDRLSVHFYSVAFLGFMSIAGIPSFLEERAVFVRERGNGLYGPGAYAIASSIVCIPFLFICALLFAVICYWAIGLHPGPIAFFRFLSFLFIAVYIAEAQSVLVAAVIPIFVAALAIASFLNGFWMCVQGYFIRAVNLPRFWYYCAHFIDYQASFPNNTFAFNLLVRNDLAGLKFHCTTLVDGTCHCTVSSSLVASGQCALTGEDVLKDLQINGFSIGLYAAILLIIAVIYRVLFYVALVFRKR